MYAYFQSRMSVEQEEADIKEMIDQEYERKEQENRDYYKQMEDWNVEREEKIKALSEKIYNALIEGGDFSYDDIACAIAYLVGCVDGLSHRKHNTSNGSFAKYVHYLIGEVNGVLDDKSKQIQSTEHAQIDEEN